MNNILDSTLKFHLGLVVRELKRDIDLRSRGHDKNVVVRAMIYTVAFIKDLTRIPLHHYRGIGQAQFRFRVSYITETAVPL